MKLSDPATKQDMVILDNRIDGVDKRIDSLEKKMDKKFEAVDKRFQEMDNKLDTIIEVVTDIAGSFKKQEEEIVILAHRQSLHNDRIEKLEKKVFGKIAS